MHNKHTLKKGIVVRLCVGEGVWRVWGATDTESESYNINASVSESI